MAESNASFLLDISRTKEGLTLWEIRQGTLKLTHQDQRHSFLVSFPDPHLYYSLIEGLESVFPMQECTIRSIYGEEDGFSIEAGREVAEQIEQQTRFQARLYNVDIRPEQRFCAESGTAPGGWQGVDRLLPDHDISLVTMQISCQANPHRSVHPERIEVVGEDSRYILDGPNRQNLDDLFDLVQSHDPDVILFPDYDRWSADFCSWAETWGLQNTLSRNGAFRSLSSRSYFSYGRMEHRLGARMPEGRLIIDTRQSFMFQKGDIRGILLASRLAGLSPNLACRLTPGTLVSSYEVYEALSRGIAVPFRKQDAEAYRRKSDMRLDFRGGLTLQPAPGMYEGVTQIDFTSFYPSIIVKYNLSPETLQHPDRKGFLATVLAPLLTLRLETKQKKRGDPRYAGMDEILKWMLVTCFGYTGYKNARFGRIEVHEQITLKAGDLLRECIMLVEEMGGTVLHGIIDCLFVQGCSGSVVSAAIENLTQIPTESETYDWIVFLPQADGSGSYGNYYGRLQNGKIKYRGVAARRRTMPPYVQRMQQDLFALMATERDRDQLFRLHDEVRRLYRRYRDELPAADPADLVITRRIGRDSYQKHGIAQAVLDSYRAHGVELKPGMDASYLVRDEKKIIADPAFDPQGIDIGYYQRLVDNAWSEVEFLFKNIGA